MKPVYRTIEEMVGMIDEPNRSACLRLLADNRRRFQTAPGSSNNHQAWPGGYHDHIQEAMNVAVVLYERLGSLRPLPFTLSDLLLVVYLHDIEKPWKYRDGRLRCQDSLTSKDGRRRFRMEKLAEYGVALTPEQENGLRYVEGESGDYTNGRRVMGPLACVAHLCDMVSARLWFDHPAPADDPWTGAGRKCDPRPAG